MIEHVRKRFCAESGHALFAEQGGDAGSTFGQGGVSGDGGEDEKFFGCGGGGPVVHEIFARRAEFQVGRGDVETDGFETDAVAFGEKCAVVGRISGEFAFHGAEKDHAFYFVETDARRAAEDDFVDAGRDGADVHGRGDALEQTGEASGVKGHAVEHSDHTVENFADRLPSRADFFGFRVHAACTVFVGGAFQCGFQTDVLREINDGFADCADVGGGVFAVLFEDGKWAISSMISARGVRSVL